MLLLFAGQWCLFEGMPWILTGVITTCTLLYGLYDQVRSWGWRPGCRRFFATIAATELLLFGLLLADSPTHLRVPFPLRGLLLFACWVALVLVFFDKLPRSGFPLRGRWFRYFAASAVLCALVALTMGELVWFTLDPRSASVLGIARVLPFRMLLGALSWDFYWLWEALAFGWRRKSPTISPSAEPAG
jgi:hypothetical protein